MGIVDAERFIADGFVKLDGAASRAAGDAARDLLWDKIGLSPRDPGTWREPVIWTSDLTGEGPFGEIIGSPQLAGALDDLCGPGGWTPRRQLGTVPVRFPRLPPADDRGWHVDASIRQPDGSYLCGGSPDTLLLLTLLSDVGPGDAATRIRIGSHRDAAAVLAGRTLSAFEAGPLVDAATAHRPVAYATGSPGDMYLLHPLTVHAADEHRGSQPRFMAQTPIFLTAPVTPGDRNLLARALSRDGRQAG